MTQVASRSFTHPFSLNRNFSDFPKRFCAVFFLALLCALTLACSNPEQEKAQHVTRGEALLKDKKYEEASLEFRNAIQIDPNMGNAHWGLAQAYEGLQRIPEAAESLRKAIEVDPNHLEARVRLGNYYILYYQANPKEGAQLLDDAERLARETLEKDPNHIEGHILTANVLFARGKRAEAETELKRAIEINPQRVESHLSLARFYMSTGNVAKADETLKRAISIDGNSALARIEYGRFLVGTNRLAQAETEFARAVEADPKNREARFVLASFYFANKQLDKAEAAYKALAEVDGDAPEGTLALANFYAATNRNPDAARVMQDLINRKPDYALARYRLAEMKLQSGDIAGARKLVDEGLVKNERDPQALVLRGRLKLIDNDAKGALEDFQQVLQSEPNSLGGLYFAAEAALRLGNADQARTFAGELERYYPNYLPTRLLLVQTALTSGDAQGALRTANELVQRSQSAAPDALMTPQMLEEIRTKALLARGTANLSLNNTAAARNDMQQAAQRNPNSASVYVNLATVAAAERRYDEAASNLERALSIDPANMEAVAALIALPNGIGAERALGRVDAALQNQGQNAQLHFLRGQALAARREVDGAEAAFRRALEIDNNFSPALYALAAMYLNTNRTEQAINEYRQITQRRPEDSTAHTMLGIIEDQRGNYQASEAAYRSAINANPANEIAANNLAWLAAEHNVGNLDEAIRFSQTVVQKNPQAGFYDTLGWVYHKKNLNSAAVEQFRKAISLSNNNPLYRYHLAVALAANGNKSEAKREVEQALRLANLPNQKFNKADDARQLLSTL